MKWMQERTKYIKYLRLSLITWIVETKVVTAFISYSTVSSMLENHAFHADEVEKYLVDNTIKWQPNGKGKTEKGQLYVNQRAKEGTCRIKKRKHPRDKGKMMKIQTSFKIEHNRYWTEKGSICKEGKLSSIH